MKWKTDHLGRALSDRSTFIAIDGTSIDAHA